VVRANLANPDGVIRPGMLMTVDLIKERSQALVIPEESLTPLEDRQYVYRVDADSTIEKLEVTIGRRRPGEVEVVAGLEAGDRVVVEGTTQVRPGMPVEIVEGSDTADETSAPTTATDAAVIGPIAGRTARVHL
jgi:membrane fusion protein (multidrug efflux system)